MPSVFTLAGPRLGATVTEYGLAPVGTTIVATPPPPPPKKARYAPRQFSGAVGTVLGLGWMPWLLLGAGTVGGYFLATKFVKGRRRRR